MEKWSNLGQKSSAMGVKTFARIKHLIWDQLLATKAEVTQSLAEFRFGCETEDFVIWNVCIDSVHFQREYSMR